MKVVLYTRVSKEDQTPESQLLDLRNYAAMKGWEVVGEYVDQVTGNVSKRIKRGQRFRYDDLMEDAEKGIFEAVLVWRFDRFARSMLHLVTALAKFEALKVNFISITEKIDTSDARDRLFFHISAAFAEFERNLISERTKAALRQRKASGIRLGQPETLTEEQKESILRRYNEWETLTAIVEAEKLPLSTIYSLIKRSLVKCHHGKYRCHTCGSIERVPVGINSARLSAAMGRDRLKLQGAVGAGTAQARPKTVRA